jgi:hypothetical protein
VSPVPFVTYTDGDPTFTIYSTDYTLGQLSTLLYVTHAIDTANAVDTIDLTFEDPCTTASFISTGAQQELIGVIGQSLTFDIVWLDDTANQLYGTSSTSSICGSTTITLATTSNVAECITLASSQVTVYCTDASLVGAHSGDVTRELSRYPAGTVTLTETSSVTIYDLIVPASPNTETYTIGSELLSFSVDLIAVTPATGSVTVSHTVTYSDGSPLDSFIGYDIAS